MAEQITKALMKLMLVLAFVASGLVVGSWISSRTYPVLVLERTVVTQTVQPGGTLLVRIRLERRDQCRIEVQRFFSYSDQSRTQMLTIFEAGFGPLGYDTYLLRMRVPKDAPRGEAYLWSQAQASCNPIENWWPVYAAASIDRFDIAGEPIVDDVRVIDEKP